MDPKSALGGPKPILRTGGSLLKNTIGDGGSTALQLFTLLTLSVDTVDTLDTVYTVGMVYKFYTVDMV